MAIVSLLISVADGLFFIFSVLMIGIKMIQFKTIVHLVHRRNELDAMLRKLEGHSSKALLPQLPSENAAVRLACLTRGLGVGLATMSLGAEAGER